MSEPSRIQSAYDPTAFRELGHRVVDMLAEHLEQQLDRSYDQVMPWLSPEDAMSRVAELAELKDESLFAETIEHCIRIHHPRYMGHQITPPLPSSAVAGLLIDSVNSGMGVYEMGVIGTAMERYVIKTVARKFGMSDDADGVLTSGGSLGNLTALLAARRAKTECDVWENGHTTQLAVMVSEQAHYCVDRAVRIMGWGSQGVIRIPVDDQYRMRTDLLQEYLQSAKQSGIQVVAVVGSACCTATGSFDDLNAIGGFCKANDIWFHVDGAHGAAVAFSEKHKHLVAGIEMADSVVLDFHKMLLTPAIVSALVFRNGRDGYRSFAQDAHYLWTEQDSEHWYDLAKRTFECTKPMYGFKIFSTMALHGVEIFEANVDRLHLLATEFANLIRNEPNFELAIEPQTNIVCFRFVGQSDKPLDLNQLNELNHRLRESVLEEGEFYIVQATLDDAVWLRTTIANPLTEMDDLEQLLMSIRRMATI